VLGLDEAALEVELAGFEEELKAARNEAGSLRREFGVPDRAELRSLRELPRELLKLPGALRRSLGDSGPADGGLPEGHPALAPIEGVSFDTWVEVQAAVVREKAKRGDIDALAQRHGVPAGRWGAIERAWRDRLPGNPGLAQRFGTEYKRALKR
jgi:hypothetical protein